MASGNRTEVLKKSQKVVVYRGNAREVVREPSASWAVQLGLLEEALREVPGGSVHGNRANFTRLTRGSIGCSRL